MARSARDRYTRDTVTSGNPITRHTSPAEKPVIPVASRSAHARPARRLAAGVVAGAAALAFAATAIIPAGLALMPAYADQTDQTSFYAQVNADTQGYLVASDEEEETPVSGRELVYEVYVTPTPTPTPTPTQTTSESTASSSSSAAEPAAEEPQAETPKYSGGGDKSSWLAAAGIAESDWVYVDYIVSKESGWNPNATNASSGACGLVQALPCSKVPGNGYDPVDNLSWADGYAVGRYGSWAAAYDFWTSNHWW